MSIINTLITTHANGQPYNAADLNRVGAAVAYIADRLHTAGYNVAVTAKQDWAAGDIPTAPQMTQYIDDISAIRGVLAVMATTPTVPPDMVDFTAAEANDIERILQGVNWLINNMIAAYMYSGEIYSGEV